MYIFTSPVRDSYRAWVININSLYELLKQRFKEEKDAFYNIGIQFIIVLNNVCKRYGIDCSNLTQAFIQSKNLQNAEIQYIMSQI